MTTVTPDRTLAQIVRVVKVEPIQGADTIELAHVLGWQCVVKKSDNFKAGDLGIYMSIDAVLDKCNPDFAFLDGKRLKTKEIRFKSKDANGNETKNAVISQGLLGPLSWLEYYTQKHSSSGIRIDPVTVAEGEDVTTFMDIKKYVFSGEVDMYSDNVSESKIQFPSFIRKTDEARIQDVNRVISDIVGKEVVITQKYDGTSTTFAYYNNQFLVCGRNKCFKSVESDNKHYFDMAEKYNLEDGMKLLGRHIAIQGETIGFKINANRHKRKLEDGNDFFVFNIWDIDNQCYVSSYEQIEEITNALGLKRVPIVLKGILPENLASVPALLDLASKQEYSKGVMAEGIVVKTNYGCENPRHSFKVISNKYLLKHDL